MTKATLLVACLEPIDVDSNPFGITFGNYILLELQI